MSQVQGQPTDVQIRWVSKLLGLTISPHPGRSADQSRPANGAATQPEPAGGGPAPGARQTAGKQPQFKLTSITIAPEKATIEGGGHLQFIATGQISNGFTDAPDQDLTKQVVWRSSEAAIRIDAKTGLASADRVSATATITATHQSTGVSGSTEVSVAAPNAEPDLVAITIAPLEPSVSFPNDELSSLQKQFSATGHYADKSYRDLTRQVEWASSNAWLLTIDQTGLATIMADTAVAIVSATDKAGEAKGAALGASTKVTISAPTVTSIAIEPTITSLNINDEQQFSATVTFSDGSTKKGADLAVWTADFYTILRVDSHTGLATSYGPGEATLTATRKGKSASMRINVVDRHVVDTEFGEVTYRVGAELTMLPAIATVKQTHEGAKALIPGMNSARAELAAFDKEIGSVQDVVKSVSETTNTSPDAQQDAAITKSMRTGSKALLNNLTQAKRSLNTAYENLLFTNMEIKAADDDSKARELAFEAKEMAERTHALAELVSAAIEGAVATVHGESLGLAKPIWDTASVFFASFDQQEKDLVEQSNRLFDEADGLRWIEGVMKFAAVKVEIKDLVDSMPSLEKDVDQAKHDFEAEQKTADRKFDDVSKPGSFQYKTLKAASDQAQKTADLSRDAETAAGQATDAANWLIHTSETTFLGDGDQDQMDLAANKTTANRFISAAQTMSRDAAASRQYAEALMRLSTASSS